MFDFFCCFYKNKSLLMLWPWPFNELLRAENFTAAQEFRAQVKHIFHLVLSFSALSSCRSVFVSSFWLWGDRFPANRARDNIINYAIEMLPLIVIN